MAENYKLSLRGTPANILEGAKKEDREMIKEICQNHRGITFQVELKMLKFRSGQQNKALHLFCSMIAEEFNKNNMFFKFSCGEFELNLDWTMELVKEQLYKPFAVALYGDEVKSKNGRVTTTRMNTE